MWVERLRIESLRRLDVAEIAASEGFVLLEGANGAGKTSVLEALYFLGYGRSFRSHSAAPCIRAGKDRLRVVAQLRGGFGERVLGLEREVRRWRARVNGEGVSSLAEFVRHCPVVCFEPEAHALICGGSELRRRLLDWTVFHVEHEFHALAGRYRRALASRNALLREGAADALIEPWERLMGETGTRMAELRARAWPGYTGAVQACWSRLKDGAPRLELSLRRGWPEDAGLTETLAVTRDRDRMLGYSRLGPHRADLVLLAEGEPAREFLSRGEQKTLALALMLAQRQVLKERTGAWPVTLLDDFPSEIDANVQARSVQLLAEGGGQIWLSGVQFARELFAGHRRCQWFHVEHGQLHPGPLL